MADRQLHIWVSEGEYHLLRELAKDRQESVSAVVRRLIRVYRLMYPAHRSEHDTLVANLVEVGPRVFG